MEFPDLGKHCSEPTCKRLDFLPIKCDACSGIFCHDHMMYAAHKCPSAHTKDVQVPVCPLCSQPVPVARNKLPDEVVGAHMDNDCQSEPAQARRKVFVNRCTMKGCKKKEMIPVVCPECQKNFCLSHRHAQDHKCEGKPTARHQTAAAAMARQGKGVMRAASSAAGSAMSSAAATAGRFFSKPTPRGPPPVAAIQGSMSEDEALARALAASMQGEAPPASPSVPTASAPLSQEEEDRQLALAIAQSERDQRRPPQRTQQTTEKSCLLS